LPVGVVGSSVSVGEFQFELRVCRWAENRWPPDDVPGSGDPPVVVARQLGTGRRRWDTVIVESDRAALEARANFGRQALDSDLLHVVRNAPAEWVWYRDALPDPGYPWRYVREAVHRAADRGIVERRRDGNRIQIRGRWPYPDWVRRLVAIENKPDLDAAAARRLGPQVEFDVALSLADEAWVATRSTGERVEPALLEDVPVEAGILVVSGDDDWLPSARVAWAPRDLPTDEAGTVIVERPSGGDNDRSAARFEYADPDWKQTKRLEVAERAYERGWRSYVETMRPDCRHFRLHSDAGTLVPWCDARECAQTPRECSENCDSFEPEPPTWRSGDWPIDGGPGKAVRRVLRRRRERNGGYETG
jgi:hypothetical protein